MIQVPSDKVDLLLEALEELMYKVSLRLGELKGGPMTPERRDLTRKQQHLEELQHQLLQQAGEAEEGENGPA